MARNFAADQQHHPFWYRESAHPKDVPSALVDTGVDRHAQPRDMAKGRVNLKQFAEAIRRLQGSPNHGLIMLQSCDTCETVQQKIVAILTAPAIEFARL